MDRPRCQAHNEGMRSEHESPGFDFLRFNAEARQARGAGVPARSPASPIFANGNLLNLLLDLQSQTGKTVYALLVEEEDKERNEKWLPSSSFFHDL